MFYESEFLCGWDLADAIEKIDKIILVLANTTGGTSKKEEQFHYIRGLLLNGLKPINELVDKGNIVIDFCIDQVLGSSKVPHDRGPHIRIPKTQLANSYREVKVILQ